jgi:hypothetical protein
MVTRSWQLLAQLDRLHELQADFQTRAPFERATGPNIENRTEIERENEGRRTRS